MVKMFGTSTSDTQPDDEIKEFAQRRPTETVGPDIEEKALRQQMMLQTCPLTESSCPVLKPGRMHSQVTLESARNQSKISPQRQEQSTKMNQQSSVLEGNKNSTQSLERQGQLKTKVGSTSSVKKKSQWDDLEPQQDKIFQRHTHP